MHTRRAPAATDGQELHYPELLHERVPNSTLDLLDAGHFVWEDAAEEYGAIVSAWVMGGYQTNTAYGTGADCPPSTVSGWSPRQAAWRRRRGLRLPRRGRGQAVRRPTHRRRAAPAAEPDARDRPLPPPARDRRRALVSRHARRA